MYHDYTIVGYKVYRRFKSMESKEIEKKNTLTQNNNNNYNSNKPPPPPQIKKANKHAK